MVTAEIMQTYDLLTFAMDDLTVLLYLKFLLITQHVVPFVNTSEAKKSRVTQQKTANVQMPWMSRTVEVV